MRIGGWDRPVVRRLVTLGLGAFFFGYLATALLFFGGESGPDVVTVPDVRRLEVPRARRQLERADLRMDIADSLPNAAVRRGAVLAQSPLPGQEVGPESEVRVILSRGRERRIVPPVTMYASGQAARVLSASGFRVLVQAVPSLAEKGRVVGTMPAGGATVEMPADVRLLVSAGPPTVAVPSVVGLLQEEARTILQGTGLRIGAVEYQFRPELAAGVVVGQAPAAGDSIEAGTGVGLQVATHDVPAVPAPEEDVTDSPIPAPVPDTETQ